MDVRVERVLPLRVAAVRVVSETPERDAWEKLRAWAEPRGLLDDLDTHPIFGFNNPNPSPERGEYGYELWVRVHPEDETEGRAVPAGEVELKDFPGGLYAVTTCRLQGDPRGSVPQIWRQLWDWVQASEYEWRGEHELERLHDPWASESEMMLDLFLPLEE
jgi:DNA gyrase inhibitor GyrI